MFTVSPYQNGPFPIGAVYGAARQVRLTESDTLQSNVFRSVEWKQMDNNGEGSAAWAMVNCLNRLCFPILFSMLSPPLIGRKTGRYIQGNRRQGIQDYIRQRVHSIRSVWCWKLLRKPRRRIQRRGRYKVRTRWFCYCRNRCYQCRRLPGQSRL